MKKILFFLVSLSQFAFGQTNNLFEKVAYTNNWVNTISRSYQAPFGNGNLKDSIINIYDANCDLVERIYYRKNASNVFILINDYAYLNYTTNHTFLSFILQNFDNNTGVLLSKFKTNYSYVQSNLVADTTYQEIGGVWKPAVAYQNFFTGNQPDSAFVFKYDTLTTAWSLTTKTYFPFVDAQNRPLKKLKYTLSNTNAFLLEQFDTLAYLNATSEKYVYEKNIQYSASLAYFSAEKKYTYDSFDNQLSSKTYTWNSPNPLPFLTDSTLNYYVNPSLGLIYDSAYSYTYSTSTGAFQLLLRAKNQFDVNNNYTSFSYEYAISASGPFTPFVLRLYDWSLCFPATVKDVKEGEAIRIYPNPSNGQITVVGNKTEYKLYSLLGNLLVSGQLESEKHDLDFSGFTKGIYFLKLGEQSEFKTYKIILE